jgi:hypothetical protein
MTPYSLRNQVLRTPRALFIRAAYLAVFICPTVALAVDEWKCVDVQQCQIRFTQAAPPSGANCKLISGHQQVEEPARRHFQFEGQVYSFPWDTCDKEALAFIDSTHRLPKPSDAGSQPSVATSEPAAPVAQGENRHENEARPNNAQMIGSLIGGIVGIVIGSLITTILVRFATSVIAKFTPPFSMAYKAALVGSLVSYLVSYMLVVIVGGGHASREGYVILVAIGFVIQTLALNLMVRDTTGARLNLAKSCLVSVLATLTFVLIIAGVTFLGIVLNS